MVKVEIKRPILKPFSKDRFELVGDYKVYLKAFGGSIAKHSKADETTPLIIPSGFKTNGANVPRIFWSIFPPNSPEYLSAVLVHDYLCDLEQYRLADECLKEMMIHLNVSKWKVYVFYYACRAYHKLKYKA